MIRSFKTFSSKQINLFVQNKTNAEKPVVNGSKPFISKPFTKFKWHKSFHDRIIRSERELNNVRNYIKNNH